jgi:hypothetical protein
MQQEADTSRPKGRAGGTPMSDEEEREQVGIGPVRMPEYLRPVYANFVNVSHTPWDYRLVFAQIRPPSSEAETQEAVAEGVRTEAVAELIIPANLMAGLITVLKQNFDHYLSAYGVPGMEPGGPELGG